VPSALPSDTHPADPVALRQIATRIGQQAEAVRRSAARLRLVAVTTPWRGAAATAFVNHACVLAARFERAAALLDDAATAMRWHAGAVEQLMGIAG
jgi:uncharacterized protein YukE